MIFLDFAVSRWKAVFLSYPKGTLYFALFPHFLSYLCFWAIGRHTFHFVMNNMLFIGIMPLASSDTQLFYDTSGLRIVSFISKELEWPKVDVLYFAVIFNVLCCQDWSWTLSPRLPILLSEELEMIMLNFGCVFSRILNFFCKGKSKPIHFNPSKSKFVRHRASQISLDPFWIQSWQWKTYFAGTTYIPSISDEVAV